MTRAEDILAEGLEEKTDPGTPPDPLLVAAREVLLLAARFSAWSYLTADNRITVLGLVEPSSAFIEDWHRALNDLAAAVEARR